MKLGQNNLEKNSRDESGWLKTSRKIVDTFLGPFLPPVIMLLFITPFFTNVANYKSASDILSAIANMPLTIILGLVSLFLYVWIKKGDES